MKVEVIVNALDLASFLFVSPKLVRFVAPAFVLLATALAAFILGAFALVVLLVAGKLILLAISRSLDIEGGAGFGILLLGYFFLSVLAVALLPIRLVRSYAAIRRAIGSEDRLFILGVALFGAARVISLGHALSE